MKPLGQKKRIRKMGFIADQEGIMNRYLREKGNWTSHLENTKNFILNAFEDKKVKTVLVFGSGWLLDFPLEQMAKRYKKIILADARHPAQIIKKADSIKNVELVEIDISGGGIAFCWNLRKQKSDHYKDYILDKFEPVLPSVDAKPDAYISLNILNQLDILLIEFLKKKKARVVDAEVNRFRERIQKFHLDWISKKPGCLITDITEMIYKPGEETDEKELIHIDLPSGIRTEEWTWDFDLSKKYHPDAETRMKVKAIEW